VGCTNVTDRQTDTHTDRHTHRQTHRQTDDRQTDGRAIVYSERKREFTFAKKEVIDEGVGASKNGGTGTRMRDKVKHSKRNDQLFFREDDVGGRARVTTL